MSDPLSWFADLRHSNLATLIVSLLALAISAVSLVLGWKAQRRQNELQERLVGIERARERDRLREARSAKIRAALISEPNSRSMGDLLRVYNDGEAEARNVKVQLQGERAPKILGVTDQGVYIGPGSHVQYPLVINFGMSPPWDLEITWVDDSGGPNMYRTSLTF